MIYNDGLPKTNKNSLTEGYIRSSFIVEALLTSQSHQRYPNTGFINMRQGNSFPSGIPKASRVFLNFWYKFFWRTSLSVNHGL
jgi:hypothetical protein